MPAPTPSALRERILAAFQQGQTSTAELARRFAISQPTVSRLLQRFRSQGTIEPKPHGGGMPPQLSKQERVRLVRLIKKNLRATGAELGRSLRPGKKNVPRDGVIWRALRNLGFSRKKVSLEADEKSRADLKKRYKSFTKKAKRTDPARLVFLDETGIDRSGKGSTAWAKLGEHARMTRPGTGA